MEEIKENEEQKILEELIGSKPEQLTGEAKRLFEAIMKIADERDELLKERQADKEKIKEYSELLIKVNVQNLNNSIEQRKESNEQLEALHEGWKIELEKNYIPKAKVIENRNKTHKEYIEVIEKNPTKAFILKCKLEAYDNLLKDGGE